MSVCLFHHQSAGDETCTCLAFNYLLLSWLFKIWTLLQTFETYIARCFRILHLWRLGELGMVCAMTQCGGQRTTVGGSSLLGPGD